MDGKHQAIDVLKSGGQVALFVLESRLPDMEIYPAIGKIRESVPTARRVVVAHWENFRTDAADLRHGQATGKYDAFLLMPRGVRDEEFHSAIIDLLNDWAATVAVPEVYSVRIVTPEQDVLTLQLRDYLDRVGAPCGVFHPDSDEGRDVLARHTGEPDVWPVVETFNSTVPFVPTGDAATWRSRSTGDPTTSSRPGGGPRGRRRRPGRARGQRVRRQRGTVHGDDRERGDRRPGGHQLDDPQLPRLPARHLRHAAGAARPQPGDPVRHPVLHRLAGDRARARHRRSSPTSSAPRAATCTRGRWSSRPASPTGASASSPSTRGSATASTTAPPWPRHGRWRAGTCSSSGAATVPVRPRSTSPASRGR